MSNSSRALIALWERAACQNPVLVAVEKAAVLWTAVTYWLDLFTGQTWQEFLDYGATVSGFRKRMRNAVNRIKPGDVLLCYLTGVMRWVGALSVQGRSHDKKMIWEFDEFAERLSVKPIVLLPPEQGVPMEQRRPRLLDTLNRLYERGSKGSIGSGGAEGSSGSVARSASKPGKMSAERPDAC